MPVNGSVRALECGQAPRICCKTSSRGGRAAGTGIGVLTLERRQREAFHLLGAGYFQMSLTRLPKRHSGTREERYDGKRRRHGLPAMASDELAQAIGIVIRPRRDRLVAQMERDVGRDGIDRRYRSARSCFSALQSTAPRSPASCRFSAGSVPT